MAFEVQGVSPTTQVQGTKVVPVREFQVVSLPSETFFQFRRAKGTPCYADPKPCAQQFSDRIEAVLALPLVTDVLYAQDVTALGRLQDRMLTSYQSEDGAIEGSVDQPLSEFGPVKTLQEIEEALAQETPLLGS